MDNIRAIRAFIEVGEAGSFVKAAERMNCSTTKVSRLVRELESELGMPLLLRTTRSVQLNSEGLHRLQECRRIVEAIDALQRHREDSPRELSGELKITTTTTFAQKRLIPLLPEFLQQHPRLKIHWRLNDDRIDLSAQGVDMAVRVAHLKDSGMVARRLGTVDIWLVAAPDLLQREGWPTQLNDVASMTCTVCTVPHFRNRWPLDPDALVDGPVWTDCGDASREAAIAGLGVGFLPDFMVEDAVADGRLIRLFPELKLASVELAILYPGREQITAAAAAFGKFLTGKLGKR